MKKLCTARQYNFARLFLIYQIVGNPESGWCFREARRADAKKG
jgi:hypothetical protein